MQQSFLPFLESIAESAAELGEFLSERVHKINYDCQGAAGVYRMRILGVTGQALSTVLLLAVGRLFIIAVGKIVWKGAIRRTAGALLQRNVPKIILI